MTARTLKSALRAVIDRPYGSENVPQSKLQDSIHRLPDLSEHIAVERCRRRHWPEAVRYVERVGTNFQPLHFTQIEASRKSHVERP
jgi:hypothetical protein